MKRYIDGSVDLNEKEAVVIEKLLDCWISPEQGEGEYIDLMDEAVDFWVFLDD